MGIFQRRKADSSARATIDIAVDLPLTPLATVDLSNHEQVSAVLNVAAGIGQVLIAAGNTNFDAKKHVTAITEAYGLYNCHVDLTYTRIRLFSYVANSRQDPVTVVHVMPSPVQDFLRLRRIDKLIWDIHSGRASLADAQAWLHSIITAPPSMGLYGVIMSWAILGGAVAILLGGDVLVALASTIASATVIWLGALLHRRGLPLFFQNVAGGLFAALFATVVYHAGVQVGLLLRPSMVIATSIVSMLAGLTLVQAIQNGVTFAPVTGNARFFDTMLLTGGVVAGVAIGIELSAALRMPLPPMETIATPNFASSTIRILGGAIASAAYARACYADWLSVGVSAMTALVGSSVFYYFLLPTVIDGVTAAALTATLIGLIGGLLARRYEVPPLIVAIAGVTPLLPGLAIYRGMYGMLHHQLTVGLGNIAIAIATAMALSAGVVLGEWIARKIRRPRGLAKRIQLTRILGRRSGALN
ncbi:MAG: threonine/serine exporter family protein [Corynebacterium sp.]|nr:threonine/serine exporter family protein [Corynebacterium sp.]